MQEDESMPALVHKVGFAREVFIRAIKLAHAFRLGLAMFSISPSIDR
jgi:hypothetical protein